MRGVGMYEMTLTVWDECGASDSDQRLVTIADPHHCAGNNPRMADAGDFLSVEVGQQLQFDGSGSYDPDGQVIAYRWNFGDGRPETSKKNLSVNPAENCPPATLERARPHKAPP